MHGIKLQTSVSVVGPTHIPLTLHERYLRRRPPPQETSHGVQCDQSVQFPPVKILIRGDIEEREEI